MSTDFVWTDELVAEVLELRKNYGKGFSDGHVINHFKKSKEVNKPLFTTEDGVDIREGDNFYMLFTAPDGIGKAYVTRARKELLPLHIYQKTFSRKELAEHWILMNKPILSLNDILSVWDADEKVLMRVSPEYYADSPMFKSFKKLAESKINNQ